MNHMEANIRSKIEPLLFKVYLKLVSLIRTPDKIAAIINNLSQGGKKATPKSDEIKLVRSLPLSKLKGRRVDMPLSIHMSPESAQT